MFLELMNLISQFKPGTVHRLSVVVTILMKG